jgi:hypothetical protein
MVNALLEMGRQGFLDGSLDWDTGTNSAALVALSVVSTPVKAISSSTAASPIVITTGTAHGFSNGDLVYVGDHLVNTAANGFWAITAASGSVFSLTHPLTAVNTSAGGGAGSATGYVVNYGNPTATSTLNDNWDDWVASIIGAKVNFASPTVVSGVADAADITFTAVPGPTVVNAVAFFKDTGTNSTSRMMGIITGRFIVTCAATLTAGTVLPVEALPAPIASGQVLVFNGAGAAQTATLTAPGAVGDRTLTVTSTTVTVGGRALANATGSGLPVTPNGGNIVVAWDNTAGRGIFKL